MTKSVTSRTTRRGILRGFGAAGMGAAAVAPLLIMSLRVKLDFSSFIVSPPQVPPDTSVRIFERVDYNANGQRFHSP